MAAGNQEQAGRQHEVHDDAAGVLAVPPLLFHLRRPPHHLQPGRPTGVREDDLAAERHLRDGGAGATRPEHGECGGGRVVPDRAHRAANRVREHDGRPQRGRKRVLCGLADPEADGGRDGDHVVLPSLRRAPEGPRHQRAHHHGEPPGRDEPAQGGGGAGADADVRDDQQGAAEARLRRGGLAAGAARRGLEVLEREPGEHGGGGGLAGGLAVVISLRGGHLRPGHCCRRGRQRISYCPAARAALVPGQG
mmetsp:Transcript_7840/g.18481  ORF Transcript_7840/g.18481 Transcript_7840/m.18481 type:complete len:250 (+) Transcript_7840:697-1446(+)